MPRTSAATAIVLALLVSGLWLSTGTRASEEPGVVLLKAETLPTL